MPVRILFESSSYYIIKCGVYINIQLAPINISLYLVGCYSAANSVQYFYIHLYSLPLCIR